MAPFCQDFRRFSLPMSGNRGESNDPGWRRTCKSVGYGAVGLFVTFLDVFKLARILDGFAAGIEMTFRQLLSPCVLGHGDMLKTRDAEGQLALECVDCGEVKRILQHTPIKGPKHGAVPVPGAPVLKVKQLRVRERSYPRSA
jgi:hypothetical protein